MARLSLRWGSMFVLASAVTVAGCAGGTPASPSAITSAAAPGSAFSSRPMDGDKDDDAVPVPDTGPALPVPISIISSYGIFSYDPNPATAVAGDTLVWTNNDYVTHHIILDDPNFDAVDESIDVGILLPGESSLPIPLTLETAQYHCTIHPSMKGGINVPPQPDAEPPYYDPYRLRPSVVK